jgi:hypothetical protein
MMSKGEWNRRYFVLRGSDMFYYKSREDFEMDPSKSIKNRPIGIAGYGVRRLSEKDKPPFEFELKVSGSNLRELLLSVSVQYKNVYLVIADSSYFSLFYLIVLQFCLSAIVGG